MTHRLDPPETFAAVQWKDGRVRLLDQRRLPAEVIYKEYDSAAGVARAITDMVVRGAPAIGIAAAYAVVLAARDAWQQAGADWQKQIRADLDTLITARPTAVNLSWAVTQLETAFAGIEGEPAPALLQAARRLHQTDIAGNRIMGQLGAELIAPDSRVITHCNAGALATGGYGTALGVIRAAYRKGMIKTVYASETRPWFQGARLTAWELQQLGIPVQLVIDAGIARLMSAADIAWLIVGADRIAANGDVANKIGTYAHTVAAHSHDVKVMVVAPVSTIDMTIASGEAIPVEVRGGDEITEINGLKVAPAGVDSVNFAFDVTPAALVDVLVTEQGIIRRPDTQKMTAAFG